IEMARRIEASLRSGDFYARWGGDEFVVMLCRPKADTIAKVAQRILSAAREKPFPCSDSVAIAVTTSIGGYLLAEGETLELAAHRADVALYAAKDGGRDRLVAHVPAMDREAGPGRIIA